jgi:hypothetical protein
MNSGAELVVPRFAEFETAQAVLEQVTAEDWVPTHPDGPYKSDGWRVIHIVRAGEPTDFVHRHPEIRRVLEYFKCNISMAVYYSMLPGAAIHEHRDLSGTLELGRLRFHVPIQTNSDVNFLVSRRPVPMKVGELWALNTSYLHAVQNNGSADRIHLVVEVEVNDWCWSKLPQKTIKFYTHYIWFMILVGYRAVRVTLTNPKAVKLRLGMAKFFLVRTFSRMLRRD